eukprot:scaffold297_cov171-Amphora_coffeaeformis.AAC.12
MSQQYYTVNSNNGMVVCGILPALVFAFEYFRPHQTQMCYGTRCPQQTTPSRISRSGRIAVFASY